MHPGASAILLPHRLPQQASGSSPGFLTRSTKHSLVRATLAAHFQAFCEQALEGIQGAVFALCVDRNGYAPTRNVRYSRPLTGDHQVDLVDSRDRRLFDDKTGLRAARNGAPFLADLCQGHR